MCKSCKDCYWVNKFNNKCIMVDKYINDCNVCDSFSGICKCGNKGLYEYEGEIYCEDCILEKFEVDTIEITEYYDSNGEYLGNSEGDFDSIVNMLSDDIEILEE